MYKVTTLTQYNIYNSIKRILVFGEIEAEKPQKEKVK